MLSNNMHYSARSTICADLTSIKTPPQPASMTLGKSVWKAGCPNPPGRASVLAPRQNCSLSSRFVAAKRPGAPHRAARPMPPPAAFCPDRCTRCHGDKWLLDPESAEHIYSMAASAKPYTLRCVIVLLLALAAGSAAGQSEPRVVDSPVVPFEELFVIEDTIRLDASVLLGQIRSLHVNDAGELLVDDGTETGIHVFSSSGNLVQSLAFSSCFPGECDYELPLTRFIGRDHIMSLRGMSAVIFDRDGQCGSSQRLDDFCRAICGLNDTIIAYRLGPEGESFFDTYTRSLKLANTEQSEPTPFRDLNLVNLGYWGRAMACFDDGPYFVFLESMDGVPLFPSEQNVRYRPKFFRQRKRDVPIGHPNQSEMKTAFPQSVGIIALDSTTRIVQFRTWDERWRLDGRPGHPIPAFSVSSNTGLFPSRSTISTVFPRTTGNGFLYSIGDVEQLPNGEFSNPVIVRYRFIPPVQTAE